MHVFSTSIVVFLFALFCHFHWRWINPTLSEEEMTKLAVLFDTDIASLDTVFTRTGPFFMVNSIKLRDDLVSAVNSSEQTEMWQAREEYNRWVLPQLLSRGCYPVFQANNRILLKAHNTSVVTFDMTVIMRYRSARDFYEIVTHPDFVTARENKFLFMERTIMTATTTDFPVLDLTVVVVVLLFALYWPLSWVLTLFGV